MADSSFDPVAYINEPRWRTSRLGLDRMRELLEALGRPQDSLRFVHVAGTNGKGSTCAYLASVLQAAGFRTGLFTSPFIETFEERIRVDGRTISLDDLTRVTLEVRAAAEAMPDHPTEFELMCAVALLHFARSKCQVVVLEVGLGGRFDATNVIGAPEVCVVARIGLDHTAVLGTTLSAVAGEKAGIIKAGAAVVSWPQEPEAMEVVQRAAAAQGCEVMVPDFEGLAVEPFRLAVGERSGAMEATGSDAAGEAGATAAGKMDAPAALRVFTYGRYARLCTKLLAAYQPYNAVLAIEAVEALRARGWSIPDEALRDGIAAAEWPGRFEVAAARPLTIVDGGHNPQGAAALADTLREVLPGERPWFVVGVLADKDYADMLAEVVPLAAGFAVYAPDNPRALPAEELAVAIRQAARRAGRQGAPVKALPSPGEALAFARGQVGEGGVVVAFGTLYAVGDLKAALRE